MTEESITLGGGCFWCIEAVLQDLRGVVSAVSGYAGGETENPTYYDVCTGRTGHAEVVEVTFHPEELTLHDLLTIFFTLHDPTTVDRQGNDVGDEYRSVVFYHTPEQKTVTQQVIRAIEERVIWPNPLVTLLQPLTKFYPAEEEHQHYFEKNPNQAYCQFIIAPKVAKLRQEFHAKLKESTP